MANVTTREHKKTARSGTTSIAIDAVNSHGQTALAIALSTGSERLEKAKLMLRYGANPEHLSVLKVLDNSKPEFVEEFHKLVSEEQKHRVSSNKKAIPAEQPEKI